jgi:hypothetical protein
VKVEVMTAESIARRYRHWHWLSSALDARHERHVQRPASLW